MERPAKLASGKLTHVEVFPLLAAKLKEMQINTGKKVSIIITGGNETPDKKEFAGNLARYLQKANSNVTVSLGDLEGRVRKDDTLVVHLNTYEANTQPKGLLAGAKDLKTMQKLMELYTRKHRSPTEPKYEDCPNADVVIGYWNFSEMRIENY